MTHQFIDESKILRLKKQIKSIFILNLLINLYKYIKKIKENLFYKIGKKIELRKYSNRPKTLFLEPSNICTANCIFCAYQYDKRSKKIPTYDSFQATIEEYIQSGGERVTLTPFAGEIFTNKEIIQWIQKIKSYKQIKYINTYTNASLLHTVNLEELMRCGLTELRISVSPLSKDSYLKIYRTDIYEKVILNIKNLLIAFSHITDKTINILEISFRADRSLEECKKLPDYIEYIHPYLSKGVIITSMSSYDSWSGVIKDSDLLPGMELLHTELSGKIQPCSRIYNPQILVDGTIRLCGCRFDNNSLDDELEIGNISEISLMEAYNSPKAKQIRNSFQTGKLLNICRKCSWYDI